ncbi:MAG: hypothetical protein ACLPPV_09105 [Candidatus Korobacteraceae bacterium]|jgi:hypothetical protein
MIPLTAQTSSSAAPSATSQSLYPEKAYLSASRYVSQYFDFSFDFPSDLRLQPVPQAAARDGSIQLLEVGGPPPADAEISISAVPTADGKNQDAKTLLRYALDQELYRGVEELRGLSKYTIAGHQFYFFETRRGIEHHFLLATTSGDYILRVFLGAHDDQTVRQLVTSFEHVVFFAPADLRQYVEASARPYDGPSVSSHQLETLEADPPASHIDAGRINGDFYENPAIGFSYRIPQGWTLEAEGAVQPAVERDRARENFGRPRVGRNEHRLMEACSRTLFSAWAKRPAANGEVSYDDFGEVTVSAISVACFPRMKFPDNAKDQQAAKNFLLQFGLTHPIIDDMRDGSIFTDDGNIFLSLQGIVGFQLPNDDLARRLSIAMEITQRRGYVLTMFFAAPHKQELEALTKERIVFDSAPPVKVADASKPEGDAAGETAPASGSAAPQTSSAAGTSDPVAVGATTSSAASSDQQPAANATRPTLLRPGETMQSQQGNGAPISKQRLSQ